ncbi:MAG: hypothetical protein Tsb0015_06750 [Simkaniaceae bacterium]
MKNVVFYMIGLPFFTFAQIISTCGGGFLEKQNDQLILHVEGTPYEMGYQHGALLKENILWNIQLFLERKNPAAGDDPEIRKRVKNFHESLPQVISYIPQSYMEEIQGLADGSGAAFQQVLMLNLFPEMFHCLGLAVNNDLTMDGTLYHVRALDYAVGDGLQQTNVLIIAKPKEEHAFVNVAYAGFIGSVTGMNEKKISVGEIGGKGYGSWDGLPMPFLLREVLQKASGLSQAREIMQNTPRTCEYFYVIGDGNDNSSFGAYATNAQITFIESGTSYGLIIPKDIAVKYSKDNKMVFTDYRLLQNTEMQTCIYDAKSSEPLGILFNQPDHLIGITGFSGPERYPILMQRIEEVKGFINPESLQEIIKAPVGRESNLHNAIFHPSSLDFWISHASLNKDPAYSQPYQKFNFVQLIKQKVPEGADEVR